MAFHHQRRGVMSTKSTTQRAKRDLREGKRPSTAAGEFVREEIEHVRQGKHGARSTRQAIAIGLSKARRAGVPLSPPKKGRVKASTRRSAERDYEVGQGTRKPRAPSPRRRLTQRVVRARQASRRGTPPRARQHARNDKLTCSARLFGSAGPASAAAR